MYVKHRSQTTFSRIWLKRRLTEIVTCLKHPRHMYLDTATILTHISLATSLWHMGKPCRARRGV